MLKREESLKLITKVFKDRIHTKRIKCIPYSPVFHLSLYTSPQPIQMENTPLF